MAKPIEPTPVLKGEDATRFLDEMKKVENTHSPEKAIHLEACRNILKRVTFR